MGFIVGTVLLLEGPTVTRNPSSEPKANATDWFSQFRDRGLLRDLDAKSCVRDFDEITKEIQALKPKKFQLFDIQKSAPAIVTELFRLRMALLDRIRPVLSKGPSSEACALSLRRALRHIRGIEDYMGAVGYRHVNPALGNRLETLNSSAGGIPQDHTRVASPSMPTLEVPFPAQSEIEVPSYLPFTTLLNPSIESAPGFRSGDVLLSRGNAAASALIARMANEDTQFSHMALVYVDPKNGQAWTIEAHIEFGSIVTPLDEWLADGKSRTMIFRYKDEGVAHRAAAWMFSRVAPSYRSGKSIEYDFPFDMKDHAKLFCSEVVREGYEHATRGEVLVPLFPSKIAMRNRDLMDRLGIFQSVSFIPADIELDPRFEVIGEWRDFKKLPDVWLKDAILTSIYTWLERDGYRFDPGLWLNTKGMIAKGIRSVGLIKDRMPSYMPREIVVLNVLVDGMVEEFQTRVREREAETLAHGGFPMTYYEILTLLEQMKSREGPSAQGPFRYLHP